MTKTKGKKPAKGGKSKSKKKPKPRRPKRVERIWWSDEQRLEAMAVVTSCGGNCAEASRVLSSKWKIPVSTLRCWHNGDRYPEGAQLRAEKEGRLANASEEIAWLSAAMLPEKLPEASAKELATIFGIMVDKTQVLRGFASTINHNKNVNVDMSAEEAAFAKNYAELPEHERILFSLIFAKLRGNAPNTGGTSGEGQARQLRPREELPPFLARVV